MFYQSIKTNDCSILFQRSSATTPLFSIVVISHNDPLITRTVRSMQAMQKAGLVELVIILDGSDEAYCELTYDLVSALSTPVQLARINRRSSKGELRNLGAELTASSWVSFIDSDCLIRQDYVVNAVRLIGSDPVITGKVEFLPGSSWFSRHNCWYHAQELASVTHAYTPNLLVNKEVFQSVGGFSHVPYGEDFHLGLTFILAGIRAVKTEDLVIAHHDNAHWHITLHKRFGYGLGRAYRWRCIYALFGVRSSVWSCLRLRPLGKLTLGQRFFHLLSSSALNLGFLCGLRRWRNTGIASLPFETTLSPEQLASLV